MIETLEGVVKQVVLTSRFASATIMSWGAVVRDLVVFDKHVVLGFPKFSDYPKYSPHMGAIAGRYANRIRGGRFILNGATHQLTKNQNDKHHLHGGLKGFGKRNWALMTQTQNSITLALHSPDGDEGYPHACFVTCTYTLLDSALQIELRGFSEGDTIMNLCHHSYFNLTGEQTILDHSLKVNASHFIPVDKENIPTGEILKVKNTVYDFEKTRKLALIAHFEQVKLDHTFVIKGEGMREAAMLTAPDESLRLKVFTNQKGLQVYDGHKINTPVIGLKGALYGNFAGIALEPHAFPDTPNNPHFGSSLLKKGEVYAQDTTYFFENNV